MLRALSYLVATPAVVASVLWCVAAIWFDGPSSRVLAGLFAGSVVLGALRCFVTVRPMRRALAVYAVGPALVLAWWFSLSPSNDRPWQADVAAVASATVDGDQLTVKNVRNFHYRSETD